MLNVSYINIINVYYSNFLHPTCIRGELTQLIECRIKFLRPGLTTCFSLRARSLHREPDSSYSVYSLARAQRQREKGRNDIAM